MTHQRTGLCSFSTFYRAIYDVLNSRFFPCLIYLIFTVFKGLLENFFEGMQVINDI